MRSISYHDRSSAETVRTGPFDSQNTNAGESTEKSGNYDSEKGKKENDHPRMCRYLSGRLFRYDAAWAAFMDK